MQPKECNSGGLNPNGLQCHIVSYNSDNADTGDQLIIVRCLCSHHFFNCEVLKKLLKENQRVRLICRIGYPDSFTRLATDWGSKKSSKTIFVRPSIGSYNASTKSNVISLDCLSNANSRSMLLSTCTR
eukprot:GHVH01016064.1.p1 GENE.GHVH01016064.1~~GHVH01016064.1.p1  ORF type:complete len:128 (-),score=4.33 GHVH01016064.1:18-401(-)